ncbi:MAG: hypothetical protein NTZ46_12205, partial [Verrucomicrobia bacterium]|nr:hypothetical protein [Verrucomicrobiota bacterium]
MSLKITSRWALAFFAFATLLSAEQPSPANSNPGKTASKTFIDYFLPTPIVGSLSTEAWGAKEVGPRDQKNGLEDTAMKQWHYWDGQILKGSDGRYHLFGSRWDQSTGHEAWKKSKAVHAFSGNLFGPYEETGLCWPGNKEGAGHNVTALQLPDGRYAVVVSATRPGDVFVSKSLDGPWEFFGQMKSEEVDGKKMKPDNVTVIVRPDGDFMLTGRPGIIYISKAADGILGPYRAESPRIFPNVPSLEDPCLFYSGGLYHIIVNSWRKRKAYHLTSKDGKTDWVNRGIAYDATV